MKKYLVAIIVFLALVTLLFYFHTAHSQISSSATSSIQTAFSFGDFGQTATDTSPLAAPTNITTSVSCNFSGVVTKVADGNSVVTFTWTATPGTIAWIGSAADVAENDDVGYLQNAITNTGTISSPEFSTPTQYIMQVSSGIATSTCSFTANPAAIAI